MTAEIAGRVGLREGSVRRILGDLTRELAVETVPNASLSDSTAP